MQQAQPQKKISYSLGKKIVGAKLREFPLVSKFSLGYRNREDKTSLPPGVLIEGSQNVLTDVSGRVGIRKGYALDGQSSSVIAPILSAYDWEMHTGTTQHLRAGSLTSAGNDGKLQFRYVASDGTISYQDLLTGLSSVNFNFCDFWNTTNSQAYLLMVNGTNTMYEWSGGVSTVASVTNSAGVISALTLNNGGSGYSVNNILTVTGGGGTLATALVTEVVNRAVATASVVNAGSGYTVNDVVTSTNCAGYQAVFKITAVNGTGGVTAFTIVSQGSGAPTGSLLGVTGGTGIGFNPIVNTTSNGTVHSIQLANPGRGYSTGTNLATTSSAGTGATVDITTVLQAAILINDTKTPAELGFYFNGSNTVLINGNQFQYTGVSGNAFVGVTPDPTSVTINAGDLIVQPPKVLDISKFTAGPGTLAIDGIANLRNQIYLGSLKANTVYISQVNNYLSYQFTSPVRVVGEGALVTMDGPWRAFMPQEDYMTIFAGLDQIYQTKFTLSADLTKEDFAIQRLKTTALQGTQSQALTSKIKNDIVYVSNEPILNTLGRVDNVVLTPQITDISYSIVNDFNAYDFTDGAVSYWKQYAIVTIPKAGLIRVYNMTNQIKDQNGNIVHYWEAPLTIPISRTSVIDGDLYGHSYLTSESYKLFTGYNDNKHPIDARAVFSYNSHGVRTSSKGLNSYFVEGYISPNTTLNLGINYDLDGVSGQVNIPILGTDERIVSTQLDDSSLGKTDLGKRGLGTDTLVSTSSLPPKFRVFKTLSRSPFYEESTSFSSVGTDFNWSILCFGSNAAPTSEGNNYITE